MWKLINWPSSHQATKLLFCVKRRIEWKPFNHASSPDATHHVHITCTSYLYIELSILLKLQRHLCEWGAFFELNRALRCMSNELYNMLTVCLVGLPLCQFKTKDTLSIKSGVKWIIIHSLPDQSSAKIWCHAITWTKLVPLLIMKIFCGKSIGKMLWTELMTLFITNMWV